MTLIDTSAWIEFLRRSGDSAVKDRVAECLSEGEAAYTCPVRFELMAGARENERKEIEEVLSLSRRHVFDIHDWEEAAILEKRLRSSGVTIPRDDIFVAVVAVRHQLPLLCKDRHFDVIRDRAEINLIVEQMA